MALRKKRQGQKIFSLGTSIFTKNLARGIGFGRERCWGYVSIVVNTSRKPSFEIYLPFKSYCNLTQCFKERCSWSIVIPSLKSVPKLHTNTSNPDLKETTEPAAHLKPCHRNPATLERILNQIVKSNQLRGRGNLWKL